MSEIITIAAVNEKKARERYEDEKKIRLGKKTKVLRADNFDITRLNIVPDRSIKGDFGFAEGKSVFVMVVQFT